MLGVAIVGLLVNIAAFYVLHGADRENLNIRGAALHVMGDMLGSAAAIIAAIIIISTGWTLADPILSVLVGVIILRGAISILRNTGHILLEGAPEGVDTNDIKADLVAAIGPVENVHHVHAWSITPERPMVTLHARVCAGVQTDHVVGLIKDRLHDRFQIDHATIEIEHEVCADGAPEQNPKQA
jgi:cobalt-zinc-cadmium efflux system protein